MRSGPLLMAALMMALGLLLGGCATSKIAGTTIDDTDENREILGLVQEYQRAVENLDADAVLALVSNRYYENNGNTDASDDYDFHGLKETLVQDFKRTRRMRLDLRVDDIQVDDDEAFAEVYYSFRAQNEYPSGVKWDTGSDRTRLRFRRETGGWRIIAGL